jgi:hypothetical protein
MGIRATGSKTRPTVQSAATWMEFSHRVQRSDGKALDHSNHFESQGPQGPQVSDGQRRCGD